MAPPGSVASNSATCCKELLVTTCSHSGSNLISRMSAHQTQLKQFLARIIQEIFLATIIARRFTNQRRRPCTYSHFHAARNSKQLGLLLELLPLPNLHLPVRILGALERGLKLRVRQVLLQTTRPLRCTLHFAGGRVDDWPKRTAGCITMQATA